MLTSHRLSSTWARTLLAFVVLLLALGAGLLSTAAQRPNGAGLVIRHGDGTLIYAYVQFDEESISGHDLITRSGIDATLAPYGGLGGAVCSLNGEGCPSDDCFCKSYSSPAFYWHYFVYEAGEWQAHPTGPSSRTLQDGEIDGWSWTADESGLPDISIDDIARMNGVERSPPTATIEPEPTLAAEKTSAPDPAPSTIAEPTSQAVIVAPGATPQTVVAGESSADDGGSTYLIVAGMAAAVLVVGGAAFIRKRPAAQ